MYVRTVKRQTKTGPVAYVQLAHNEWDPAKQQSVARVLASFGRADEVDVDGIRRLIASLQRLIGEAPAAGAGVGELDLVESRVAGGALLLDGLWRQIGIDKLITGAGQKKRGRHRDLAVMERILFGLVANRALAPSSKLAAVDWMNHDVDIPRWNGVLGADATVDEDACYRAMDWLHEAGDVLARNVYFQVTDLLNLEVDLLFFDATSTYFEVPDADEPVVRDDHGMPVATSDSAGESTGDEAKMASFRTWGKSKDSRGDLPQIVIGLAVTRDGIPVRCWCWPGNTTDSPLIRQVREDMREWTLSRVIYAADRGFTSEENRRELMRGGDGYILGEKLRSGSKTAKAALSRQGRYKQIAENMQVKEVKIGDETGATDRFIVCYNPDQAVRDAATRARHVAQLTELIDDSDELSATKRAILQGRISEMPTLKRFLRVTPGGLLRVDKKKIDAEENLDGKYLLRTSDPNLSVEDIALGYKQLLQVERAWRDMKSTLDLRPVYHRLEERIRAHVTLCWLALLLIRITENATEQTWDQIKPIAQRLHAVTYAGIDGTARAYTLSGADTRFRLLTWPFLSVYAARLYSLIKPPRTSSRLSRALSRSVGAAFEVGCGGRRSRAR